MTKKWKNEKKENQIKTGMKKRAKNKQENTSYYYQKKLKLYNAKQYMMCKYFNGIVIISCRKINVEEVTT